MHLDIVKRLRDYKKNIFVKYLKIIILNHKP